MSQTVFITGASTGLGRLTAIYFAQQGWNVAATMRNPEKGADLTGYGNTRIFKMDVTDAAGVRVAAQEAIAAFGRIDVVINNAGQAAVGPLEMTSEEIADRQYAVNVRGVISVIKAFLPHFKENGGGAFINISSLMGISPNTPLASLYSMAKFALEGLTEGLYYELAPLNIRLRLVEPGGFESDFGKNLIWCNDETIKGYERITAATIAKLSAPSAGPRTDPQDIVHAVYALATGKSNRFRTVIGADAEQATALRASSGIDSYLEKIAAVFS